MAWSALANYPMHLDVAHAGHCRSCQYTLLIPAARRCRKLSQRSPPNVVLLASPLGESICWAFLHAPASLIVKKLVGLLCGPLADSFLNKKEVVAMFFFYEKSIKQHKPQL